MSNQIDEDTNGVSPSVLSGPEIKISDPNVDHDSSTLASSSFSHEPFNPEHISVSVKKSTTETSDNKDPIRNIINGDGGVTYNNYGYNRSSVSPVPEFRNLSKKYDYSRDSMGSIDRDYTTRLLDTAGAFQSSVRDNIYSHEVLSTNPPEAYVNPMLSNRSRYVMRSGYDLGFVAPKLKASYEVCFRPLSYLFFSFVFINNIYISVISLFLTGVSYEAPLSFI